MMVTMRGTDYDTARVASAMKGHLAQQKAVIVFQPSEPGGPEGEHFMASWDVDDDAATTHGKLEQLGVTFHTLQPLDGGGTRVFVYGMDQEAFGTVEKAGAAYDTEIEFTHGTGEFLGTTKEDGTDAEQRADAQRVYEETLAQAAPHEGRDVGAIWQDVRDHWSTAFGAAKGGEPSKEPGAAEPGKAGAAEAVAPREASLEGYSKEATLKNGVIHTADVDDAARALHEGRRVELDQVRSVSVLLDRLAAISERMIQRGEKAPTVDLCKVSVAGTNLFCSESKGIPRIEMPQMDEPTTKKFIEHLESKGYKVTNEDQYASYMRATQNELNGSKVAGIAKSMRSGEHEKGPQHAQVYKPPRMVVSSDDYILDGHHRWAAKVGNDSMDGILTNDTKIEISRVDIDIVQLLDEAHKFTEGKGRKGVGDRRTKDFNPYHEPGGTPVGGRFAAGGGSGGGAETSERGGGGGLSKPKLVRVREAAQQAVKEGAARSPAKPLEGSKSIHPATVASRIATSVKADKSVYRQPSLEAMHERAKTDEDKFGDAIALLKDPSGYPNLRPSEAKGDPTVVARTFIDHVKANLRFLYDAAPQRLRDESHLWYEGARLIATDTATTYKLNDAAVVGVYAALSPQKLWDQNVYLAQELVRIHQTQRDFKWDEKMDAVAERIWMPKNPEAPTKNDMTRQALAQEVMGKKLGELSNPVHKAMWIRTYSEAHTDRHYKLVKPTGEFGALAVNRGDGKLSTAAWQSVPMLVNAINALESDGDRDKISDAMGDEHKVRSFYNNILDPSSANGDVTMDTHAFGAGLLRPLSGASTAVMHGLGTGPEKGKVPKGWQAAPKSAVTGSRGLYGLYATAYRELAHDLHMEPRQLQSVTWEAKRLLFDDSLKDAEKKEVERLWVEYHEGRSTLAQTQKAVLAAAGGFEK